MSENSTWNPPYPIHQRLFLETAIGIVAGLFVSPLITVVDKGITQNASGAKKLFPSMLESLKSLATKPHIFLRKPEQLWIWSVYAGTYATANSVDSFCKNYGIPHEMPKLTIVFGVNMTLSILKDRALVKLFGTKPPAAVPMQSFALWAVRDIMTVLCAFIIPSRLSSYLSTLGYNKKSCETTITFWCPILLQTVTTPIHLLGLDWYNNQQSTLAQRMQFLQREYLKTLLARMGRMTPAYGIGGVANLKFRQHMFGNLDNKKM